MKKFIKLILYPFIPRSFRRNFYYKIQLLKYFYNNNLKLRSDIDERIANDFMSFKHKYTKEDWQKLKDNLSVGLDQSSINIINEQDVRMSYISQNNCIDLNKIFNKQEIEQQKICSNELMKLSYSLNKFKFSVITDESFYGYSGLRWLPKEIQKKIQSGICIDGGACEGDTAIMLLKKFKAHEIHAFEINEDNYIKTLETIRIAGVDNIKPKLMGLSNENGIASVDKNGGESKIMKFKKNETSIPIRRLDDIYFQKQKISLIKLDVEGAELKVLKGAENILRHDKPILAISIYHNPYDFFFIKPWIESVNKKYTMSIVRAAPFMPVTEIMLLAY